MRLAGHCVRHDDEVANKLVLWQPTDGHANRRRQKVSYVGNLLQDVGLGNTSELQTVTCHSSHASLTLHRLRNFAEKTV